MHTYTLYTGIKVCVCGGGYILVHMWINMYILYCLFPDTDLFLRPCILYLRVMRVIGCLGYHV